MNRIMSSMLMSMVAFTALAQSANGRPTLVVGIVIDQLRSDYIELLQQRFSDSGFNRLISDGAYFENVDFSIYNPDIDAVYANHHGKFKVDEEQMVKGAGLLVQMAVDYLNA